MPFSGFPSRVRQIPVPAPVFGELLAEIQDLAELKCVLRVIWLLQQKKGFPRFVAYGELAADRILLTALGEQDGKSLNVMVQGLRAATRRGVLIRFPIKRQGVVEEGFVLNDEAGRRSVEGLQREELAPGKIAKPDLPLAEPTPGIFALYEENIGLLTPLIADELKEAEKAYPPAWILEAFQEAASLNKRNWRYVSRILERWATEGKENGESGRHPKEVNRKEYLRRWGKFSSSR